VSTRGTSMIVPAEFLDGVRRLDRNFSIELDACGVIGPVSPIPGERYAAAGIYSTAGDSHRLAAFAICHLDDDGFVLDFLARDVTDDEMKPELSRYGLKAICRQHPLDDDVGCALFQAVATALDELQRPPAPPPSWTRSWPHALVHERICEVSRARAKLYQDLGDCPNTVHAFVDSAVECFHRDDVDGADWWARRAEREIANVRARAAGGRA
jgi:hypothetical protein